MIKLYNSLYDKDKLNYRGTLEALKIMIIKEMKEVRP